MSKNLIMLKKGNDMVLTNEERLMEEFNKLYQESGEKMSKEEYFYSWYPDIYNGNIDFLPEEDRLVFKYDDWSTMQTYNHIVWTIEDEIKRKKDGLEVYGQMFYTLLAMQACGALNKSEYEVLHRELCEKQVHFVYAGLK